MEVTVRPAAERDAGAVADLWTEAYVAPGTGGRTEPYSEADFIDSARRGQIFVAMRGDGEVVGAVVLLPPGAPGAGSHRTQEEAELSRLAVAPSGSPSG